MIEIGTALGNSVAIDGDTIVAGAPYYVTMTGVIGAAVVYTMPLGGWRNETENAVLDASDGADQDQLGWSVAVSGNEIAAGAPGPPQGATATGKGLRVHDAAVWLAGRDPNRRAHHDRRCCRR